MADGRPARPSSRHITLVPAAPTAFATPKPARALRTRTTRSQSREVEQQPVRRSARQASVASDRGQEKPLLKRVTGRNAAKELQGAAGDLSPVNEGDTSFQNCPQSTPRPPRNKHRPYPLSPSPVPHNESDTSAHEISGTTAINSPSILEADSLKPTSIQFNAKKLYHAATDLLQHLVSDEDSIDDDAMRIKMKQDPSSVFTLEFQELDDAFCTILNKFKTGQQQYIQLRAVHRALNPDQDPSHYLPGLDDIIYLANLATVAKRTVGLPMDHADDVIRDFDRQLFQHLLPALVDEPTDVAPGYSALLTKTFDLALTMRTQLANSRFEGLSAATKPDVDSVLDDIFYLDNGDSVRGWDIPGLKARELTNDQRNEVAKEVAKIKEAAPDVAALFGRKPWLGAVLRLMQWMRLRYQELRSTIEGLGGIDAVARRVKNNGFPRPAVDETSGSPSKPPRRRQTSFTKARRRSSGKFKADGSLSGTILDALFDDDDSQGEVVKPTESIQPDEGTTLEPEQADGPKPRDSQHGHDQTPPMVGGDDDDEQQQPQERGPSQHPEDPPTSPGAIVRLLREKERTEKENQNKHSLFERQPNATRVEFGDGFDSSQRSPAGPSRIVQPASRKRARDLLDEISETSDDDEPFETRSPAPEAATRRAKAPPAKRVRIAPPPSLQPQGEEGVETVAEAEAAVEERSSRSSYSAGVGSSSSAGPRAQRAQQQAESDTSEDGGASLSTWQLSKKMAAQNRHARARSIAANPRARRRWTDEEEEALRQYMREYPRQYAKILEVDRARSRPRLTGRTQVHLKDKARNMAVVMLERGGGLGVDPGFEGIVHSRTKEGRRLLERGFELHDE